jgi:pimeloyl-ACP methyl ester carboxylesterase
MRKLAMIGAFALLCFSFCALPCAAQQSIDGDWTGGIDFEKSWQAIKFHFIGEKQNVSGTLDFPSQNRAGLSLSRIVIKNAHMRVEWQGNSGLAVFEGLLKGDSISGEFTQGERKAKFGLVRVAKVDPKLYEKYSGSYQLSPDRFIDLGPIGDSARFVDSKTRRTRYLYPSSDTSFFSGPSVGIPFPVELRVTFLRDKQGKVSGLIWKEKGSRSIKGTRLPYKEEDVSYQYGDATVTAKLLLPVTQGPYPALIDVGQGYFLGSDNGPDQYFYVRQGLAMMTPVRRTVGGAEANYLKSSFEERAREVLAGVEMLKKRKDINSRQIGLYGDSQTAWIAPLAAALSPDVGFLILRVPSALPVTENILYEIESNLRRDNFSEADITKAIAFRQRIHRSILSNIEWENLKAEVDKSKHEKWFPYVRAGWFSSLKIPPDEVTAKGLRDPLTFDPVPVLETITIPLLAMNGELDEAVPTKKSVPILERALRKAGNKDFTVIVLPKAGHNFMQTDRPYGVEEFVRKKEYVSGYWDTIADWLRKHLNLKPYNVVDAAP